jgi:hypothetical protein
LSPRRSALCPARRGRANAGASHRLLSTPHGTRAEAKRLTTTKT